MQEAGLPERVVYKSLILSLRRNTGGQYRQKRGNRPWELNGLRTLWEWSDWGHGLQGADLRRGYQGRDDQAEDYSLPILGGGESGGALREFPVSMESKKRRKD